METLLQGLTHYAVGTACHLKLIEMRVFWVVFSCVIAILTISAMPVNSQGDEDSTITGAFFYDPGCPCSERPIEILNQLQANHTNFEISWYDLDIGDNYNLSKNFIEAYNVLQDNRTDYPFLFVGDYYFSEMEITYNRVAQTLAYYEGQNVSLWPDWEVKWTICVVLFFDSSTSDGWVAFDMVRSLDTTHLRLGIYDTYNSFYNSTLLSRYLDAYGSYLTTTEAALFIGDDFFIGDDINYTSITSAISKYWGHNTYCKYVQEPADTGNICVTVFYSSKCGECSGAKKFLHEIDGKYPELNIRYYNILEGDNEALKHSYCEYYNVPTEERGMLVVFIGDKYFTNLDDLKEGFEEQVKRYEDGIPCPEIKPDDSAVIKTFESFSVFAIMVAGLIDGLNPCAFATLIFLLLVLTSSKKSEKQILLIGILFVLGVFTAYLLLGIGLFRAIETADQVDLVGLAIYIIAGAMALIFGTYSLYDYTKIKRGKTKEMVLKLPKKIREIVRRVIQGQANIKYFAVFAFPIGMLIAIFEFVCTGQVYLPTIVYMTGVSGYGGQAFSYLVLYNLMFILPLILIFLAAYFGVGHKKLKAILKKHVGLIKLLTAVIFYVLAAFMIVLSLEVVGWV